MDQAQQLRNVIKKQNQKILQGPARVITVTSGKGGVGKSNVAVNLAVQFQRMGKKVIIFDADFGLANVEVMFGAMPKYNLSDLVYRDKKIEDILSKGPEGIEFISAGSGILSLNNLSRNQITYIVNAMKQLESMADVIIIDTGAGVSDSVMEFVLASPEILLVTTPDPTSLTDSYSLLKALHNSPEFFKRRTKVNVVANRALSVADGDAVFRKLESVVKQFLDGDINYIGMIPQDASLEKAVRQQKPVSMCYPDAKSAKAFRKLADELMSNGNSDEGEKWTISKLFQKITSRE